MERFVWKTRPTALPENCVIAGNCRITVLTGNLLRLEYVPGGCFEDRASQMAFFRDFPKCNFDQTIEDGVLTIRTDGLKLQYRLGMPFAEDTLSIRLLIEPASAWHYGQDFEDLGGTARTLDRADGRFPVDRGVCSRNGFSVLDDSSTLLLTDDGDVAVRAPGSIDCYFFGYGFDYVRSVQDLYRLTGAPPLLPAYALGNWWSRYYAYTQQEYLDLMDKFRESDIPLSVGVVDMDWHITQVPEALQQYCPKQVGGWKTGWTGYTWNTALFPDYRQFLRDLHERNLKTALNLHPAQGVCPHEAMYPQIAKACGIDPESKHYVPLNVLSQEYMAKYFDILHHPYEDDGVDFWWMDWQQGTDYWWIHEPNQPGQYQDERERMDPLWILNHLHILDITRNGKRPMFFSRYSGPGSHRYPVGFSGDTIVSWDSLEFQPEFTATASNVGYRWWSHDIGGHTCGIADHELYIRWLQLGVFSPINRLHSTKDRFMFKEPWKFPKAEANIAGRWLRLRHSLFPYIYTMNYRNHQELLPLVQPMYYSHPKCSGAYENPKQFWFGDQLIVSPVTQKNDPQTGLGCTKVWLPKGNWFDFFTGLRYASRRGRTMDVFRRLDDMPVFAKAGAIVPMANYAPKENRLLNSDAMTVLVFPGDSNRFRLYEDAGEGNSYEAGAFAQTEMELNWNTQPEFTIHAVQGDPSLIPAKRTWRIGLRGFQKELSLQVLVNGTAVAAEIYWGAEENTHWITVAATPADTICVKIVGDCLIWDNRDVLDRCEVILQNAQIPYMDRRRIWEQLIRENADLWLKKYHIVGAIACGVTGKAIMELLSLTEDPYTGSQLPE